MAQQSDRFVTWSMVPSVWFYTQEQERTWLENVAPHYPGQSPQSLVRHVAIELPDCPPAWEYQDALRLASLGCDDLVPVIITSRTLWEDRKEQMVDVLGKLLARTPPISTFSPNVVAMAVLRDD